METVPGFNSSCSTSSLFRRSPETHAVSNDDVRVFALNRVSRTLPASMTNTQSSIVIDVSAMFVDMTTLRTPGAGLENARFCSSAVSVECKGTSKYFGGGFLSSSSSCELGARCSFSYSEARRRSCNALISPIPGRKTRMAPSS